MHVPATYANPDILRPAIRFMDVRMSANHRTETQIEGTYSHSGKKLMP